MIHKWYAEPVPCSLMVERKKISRGRLGQKRNPLPQAARFTFHRGFFFLSTISALEAMMYAVVRFQRWTATAERGSKLCSLMWITYARTSINELNLGQCGLLFITEGTFLLFGAGGGGGGCFLGVLTFLKSWPSPKRSPEQCVTLPVSPYPGLILLVTSDRLFTYSYALSQHRGKTLNFT